VTTPVLYLLVGPDGAGKTTLFERLLEPVTGLPFVNADRIAAERWPGDELAHAYDAAAEAAQRREAYLAAGRRCATQTGPLPADGIGPGRHRGRDVAGNRPSHPRRHVAHDRG
jgi:ribose 1,5-bisphosphokinase PhnN